MWLDNNNWYWLSTHDIPGMMKMPLMLSFKSHSTFYYPHFTDQETEEQGSCITAPAVWLQNSPDCCYAAVSMTDTSSSVSLRKTRQAKAQGFCAQFEQNEADQTHRGQPGIRPDHHPAWTLPPDYSPCQEWGCSQGRQTPARWLWFPHASGSHGFSASP